MKILTLFIFLLSISPVSAEDNFIPGYKKNWLFLGAEYGNQSKTDVESPEVENSGNEMGIKAVYSHYWKEAVADIGLGFRNDKMDEDVEVETRAFFLELGGRYRLTDRISLGPQFHMLVGQDVSFSDVGTNSDDKPSAFFLGARVFYDFSDPDDEFMIRLGLQGLTDLDIDNRKVDYYQVVAEVGIPFGKAEPRPTKKPKAKPAPKPIPKPKINFSLKDFGVTFKTGSAELSQSSEKVMQDLAKVLNQYEKEWTEIKIEGHTDITGSYQKNMSLSDDRANAVKDVLVKNQVPADRVIAKGFGPDKPLDPARNRTAYAKNRRVEMQIFGEDAGEEFLQQLKLIIKKYSKF